MCYAGLATVALVLLAAHAGAADTRRAGPPAVGGDSQRVHLVARGDTLSGLAARYRVSVAALVAANRLSGERAVLRVGQRLVVPTGGAPGAAAAGAATPARPAAPTPAKPAPSIPGTAAESRPGKKAPAAARRPGAAPSSNSRPRPRMVTRGPRGLELAVPDFVESAPPFLWPVEGPVTSIYGRRRSSWHRGIDIKAEAGSVVFAAAGGVVVAAGVEPRYGRVVKIEHDDGFLTVYAHNEENLVDIGMPVAAGDPIATIGRTGRATAHHLHFEIRRGASVYNPLYLLPLPARVGQVDLTEDSEEEHE